MNPHTLEETAQLVVPIAKSLQKRLRVQAIVEDRKLKDIVSDALLEYLAKSPHSPEVVAVTRPKRGVKTSVSGPNDHAQAANEWREYRTPGHNKPFLAKGNLRVGFELNQSGKPRIDAGFIDEFLRTFGGQTVVGGFNMTDPPKGGAGHWVGQKSSQLNSRKLTARHACFLVGILMKEAGVRVHGDGPHKRVILTIPEYKRT